jgi:Ni,Fe-hydrogenase III large subunit
LQTHNTQAFAWSDVPILAPEVFRKETQQAVETGARLAVLTAIPVAGAAMRLLAVLQHSARGVLTVLSCQVKEEFLSLTPSCPQAQGFEREIYEIWGIRPVGHPWLKPVRFQPPADRGPITEAGRGEFFSMRGEEIHEVAVGPVHAGVIEPGHFRFQCHGEVVYHLEISLGYQHRGVERALHGGPDRRTLHYLETLAGDTSIGHATAGCRALEALSEVRVPPRAEAIRGIAAEMERLANHIGDLGAMSGDVGFLPTMSFCGRLRGEVLNMTATLCGNRFGRGLIVPGGVTRDLTSSIVEDLLRRLKALESDTRGAVELMFANPGVLERFEGTGVVPVSTAIEIGMLGVVSRACGLETDIRHNLPYGIYRFAQIPLCTWSGGDCFARAYVRWMEVRHAIAFIREQLAGLPGGPILQPMSLLAPQRAVISLTEGWRGAIVHLVITDSQGRFLQYKVVDPSFINWLGLAVALRGQRISDFPLCNKSFNLSYCGHDL